MRFRLEWLVVVVVTATAACGSEGKKTSAEPARADGAAATDSRTAATPPRRQIVFMGTSLTAGLGLEPEQAFPALIGQRIDSLGLSYGVRNAGVSGETSAGALRRIGWVLHDTIDVLVLETGANDGLRGLGTSAMTANIQSILDSVTRAKPQASVFLAEMNAPPNMGARYTAAFHQAFVDLSKKNGVTLIPFLLAGVAGIPALNQPDGIHPNVRGEEIVAENVWRVLAPALSTQRVR
ncbi:MAG: arylesterase [Gemmatimonadaceae bacterium]